MATVSMRLRVRCVSVSKSGTREAPSTSVFFEPVPEAPENKVLWAKVRPAGRLEALAMDFPGVTIEPGMEFFLDVNTVALPKVIAEIPAPVEILPTPVQEEPQPIK